MLALADEELIDALGGGQRRAVRLELAKLETTELRDRARATGLEMICRCDPGYPARLRELSSPPATLYVAGGLERFLGLVGEDPVAIVGSRRPSAYGLEVARSLGRGLSRAGLTVLSGMALGIDSAAQAGAIGATAPTVAVLPGPAERPYPSARRGLYRQITAVGAAVSELAPGAAIRRWAFPARNRIIAALAAMTVVVEAAERSGALLTAAFASELGRAVGAVPGQITSAQAAGPNRLLAGRAEVIRGPQDVLDHLYGAGVRSGSDGRGALTTQQRTLLGAISDGHDTTAALAVAGFPAAESLAGLASLELAGFVRRSSGGRWVVVP